MIGRLLYSEMRQYKDQLVQQWLHFKTVTVVTSSLGSVTSVVCGFESRRPHQNVLMKDATPHESAVFSHIIRHFRMKKLQKLDFSKFQFCPARGDILKMRPARFVVWCGSNTEAKKRIKNKKAGRRSAPHVGENGGLFRYIGAYVAFASCVYHSLVVLVIAFS